MDVDEENYDCILDSNEMTAQFIIRIIVLSIALLSTLFIAITCKYSKRMQYWCFKLLFWQSIAESIDLTLAISFSINSKCSPYCPMAGYIMHSSWLTSFLCSMAISVMYFALLKPIKCYEFLNRNINAIIFLFYLIPYMYLGWPFSNNVFKAVGWKIEHEYKYFYCGFGKNEFNSLLTYFAIPFAILGLISIYFSYRSKNIARSYRDLGIPLIEFELLLNVYKFPIIYVLAWFIHYIPTIVWMFEGSQLEEADSIIVTYLFVTLKLLFEMHIFIVAICFYIYYDPILRIRRIWFCRKVVIRYIHAAEMNETLNPSMQCPSVVEQPTQ